jgi:amidophosphoribosyltransferase
LIRGKNLAILDDSIMRGDSSLEMFALLEEAGVNEVHFISAWPPNFFHCNKGIDTPTDEELIAHRLIEDGTVEYSPEKGVRYDVKSVNMRMTEIMREELAKKYRGRYDPKKLYVHYGTIEMQRSVLPTKDNCEFCITGIDPELRQ